MEKDPKERRACIRFAISISASLFNGVPNQEICGQTKDISIEGIGIATTKALIPGNNIDLTIKMLDNQEEIRLRGKVVWSDTVASDKYRAGIELLGSVLKPIPLVLRTIIAQKHY
jgi:hypothetical protein